MTKFNYNNWGALRIFYLILGLLMFIPALYEKQWIASLFGFYFIVSSVFNIGCASGYCSIPKNNTKTNEIDFEDLLKSNWTYLIVIIVGLILGYTYWYFFGCQTNCTIKSNSLYSSLYGALMSTLLFNIFKPQNK